jgi:hypothetical protein
MPLAVAIFIFWCFECLGFSFDEMSCFPYIFNAFSADLSGSHSVPLSRRFKGIALVDMIIPTALQLILHFKSNVRTETPEDQGPQISCELYQNLVAMNNISKQRIIFLDL